MVEKSLGLDIGSKFVKLIELVRQKNNISVTKIISKEILYGDSDSPPPSCAIIAEILSDMLKEIDNKRAPLSFISSTHTIFIRIIKVPNVPKDKMKKVIQYEIQKEIPFSLDEVSWDYSVIEGSSLECEEQEATVVAIKKGWLQKDVEVVENAGFNPVSAEIPAVSLYNLVKIQSNPLPGELNAILDIGALNSNLILYSGNKFWVRNLHIAGEKFTSVIEDHYKISKEEAELLKRKGGSELISKNDLMNIFVLTLDSLANEINKSVEYFCQNAEFKNLSNIIISGGGARLSGIDKYLREKLGINVVYVDPFKNFTNKTGQEIDSYKLNFAVAAGLALRNLGNVPVDINLLEGHLEYKRILKQKKLLRVVSALLFLAIVFCSTALGKINASNKKLRLLKVENIINECREVSPEIKKNTKYLNEILMNLDYFASLLKTKHVSLDCFKVIRATMPTDVLLDNCVFNFDYNKSKVGLTIGGTGASYQSINNFVSGLRENGYFSDVKPISSVLIKDDSSKRDFVTFVIKLEI
ncbi:type IV pilus assembly protein PilM [bacterium]|nr:type IV pilus assembly protein PilM [bacterium]